MNRIKKGAALVTKINKYRKKEIQDWDLLKSVVLYFDDLKNSVLSPADLKFLKYISNTVGVPHYYDLLNNFSANKKDISYFNMNTFSALVHESTLHRSQKTKLHRYQKEIVDNFIKNKLNRFFLSASTSFGKTFVVYEILQKMDYENIVLIFPTIALLSENLDKINNDNEYSYFKSNYKIHTLSEPDEMADKNLFIFTPERFLSFLEKKLDSIHFDFIFIDEVYKIDNDYIINDQAKENERDVAYRLATHYSLFDNVDLLLAGPYIQFSSSKNNSFNIFLERNNIKILNYNRIETVSKSFHNIKNKKECSVDASLNIEFSNGGKKGEKLSSILFELGKKKENTIVYCSSRSAAEKYSKDIINLGVNNQWNNLDYSNFIRHLKENFHEDWIIIKALENGIGIHHGLVPKYIQKEIIELFNKKKISTLLSTTTITEGVNTSAKNLVVLHSKKGSKKLKGFDAKNIAGRAGRFRYHFSGRVFVLQNDFMDALESEQQAINHKNYDLSSPKDEIDLFYTTDEFLNNEDIKKKENIIYEQQNREIPEDIINKFKVVSREDKIKVFDIIKIMTPDQRSLVRKLITATNSPTGINFEGLQVILDSIAPIIKNQKMEFLVNHKVISKLDEKEYSLFSYLLHYYLKDGFVGSMKYKIKTGKNVDLAIRESADFIYNTLKYQAVKYLGVFNLMYKHIKSEEENKSIDDVVGIDKLLMQLEYNALTFEGRVASDYGVPSKILEYYEKPDFSLEIKRGFDDYEKKVFQKINKIINDDE